MSWRSKSSKTPATQVKRVSTGTRSLAQERVAQDLKGADLRGADLSFTNLNGRSLEGADLAGATLKGAYMTGANLAGTDLTGVDLSGACLDKVKSADIVGSPEFLPDGRWRLVAGYLIGPEANLRKALLSRANLSYACLDGAVLKGADLSDSDCSGASFGWSSNPADLSGANLTRANVAGTSFVRGAVLSKANLTQVVLREAVLVGADLSDTDLRGFDLRALDLIGVNFARADLTGADLSGSDLTKASVENAESDWNQLQGCEPLWPLRVVLRLQSWNALRRDDDLSDWKTRSLEVGENHAAGLGQEIPKQLLRKSHRGVAVHTESHRGNGVSPIPLNKLDLESFRTALAICPSGNFNSKALPNKLNLWCSSRSKTWASHVVPPSRWSVPLRVRTSITST